jgi:hypothetical protein
MSYIVSYIKLFKWTMGKVTIRSEDQSVRSLIGEIAKVQGITHLNLIRYPTNCERGFDYGYSGRGYPQNDIPTPDLISLNDFIESDFKKIMGVTESTGLGLCSLVRLKTGLPAHLIQLDIDSAPKEFPLFMKKLESIAKLINVKSREGIVGYVAQSGSGYHIYGTSLLDDLQWRKFNESLKEGNEFGVDPIWATNLSLKRGCSVLRLNSTKQKPLEPSIFLSLSY